MTMRSWSNWNFSNVGFCGGRKKQSTRRKTIGAGTRTNNKLNLHMVSIPGIESGKQWWAVKVLTYCSETIPIIHLNLGELVNLAPER